MPQLILTRLHLYSVIQGHCAWGLGTSGPEDISLTFSMILLPYFNTEPINNLL